MCVSYNEMPQKQVLLKTDQNLSIEISIFFLSVLFKFCCVSASIRYDARINATFRLLWYTAYTKKKKESSKE